MSNCPVSSGTDLAISPQVPQQMAPSISQSMGRLITPVPTTPPSMWVSDFFWITLAVSILAGVILEKWHKK